MNLEKVASVGLDAKPKPRVKCLNADFANTDNVPLVIVKAQEGVPPSFLRNEVRVQLNL